jgi:hypothetical protein
VIVKQLDGTQIVFEGYKRESQPGDNVLELFGRHIAFK